MSNILIRGWVVLAGLAGLLTMFPVDEAMAVPAFARSHNAPCTMCHSAFPKLNYTGMEFEHNGFRMEGDKGKYLWEQPIPLAGHISTGYTNNKIDWNPEMGTRVDSKSSAFDLNDWQLFTAGTLAPGISFFGQLVGHVEGLEADATNGILPMPPGEGMADVMTSEIETETFWFQVNDVLPDSIMNVRIGKDHVDNHFLSTPLRTTRAGYLIQIQPMLGASLHPSSVGAEINGIAPFVEYNIGIRNYGPGFDSTDDNEQRLGAYYVYLNRHIMEENTISFMLNSDRRGDENTGTDDDVLGYGLSFDFHFQEFNFITGLFQYTEGGNIRSGDELNATSGTLELLYPIRNNMFGTVRYDFNKWDIDSDTLDREADQFVLSLAWYQQPNVRWIAEYSQFNSDNLMLMGGHDMRLLNTTPSAADLTIDTLSVLLEANF